MSVDAQGLTPENAVGADGVLNPTLLDLVNSRKSRGRVKLGKGENTRLFLSMDAAGEQGGKVIWGLKLPTSGKLSEAKDISYFNPADGKPITK